MAAPRPGNTDRGWNDPPMFDYQSSSNSSSGSPHHTKLNKRVAYPMGTESSVDLPKGTATLLNPSDGPPRLPPVHILPPASSTTTPTPVPLVVPTLSPTMDPCGDSLLQPAIFSPTATTLPGMAQAIKDKVSEVLAVKDLPSVLGELSLESEEALLEYIKAGLHSAAESVQDTLKGRAMEDVKKKLVMMGEWWTSGKISQSVKSQLGSLVSALNQELVEQAHELHLALMINHTTEVNQWMVGIKRIIQELRTKVAGSVTNQETDPPNVLDPCLTVEEITLPNTLLVPDLQNVQSLEEPAVESALTTSESESKDPDTPAEEDR